VAEPGSADGCIFAVGVVMMVVMVKLCRQRWRHSDSEQNSVCIIYIFVICYFFSFLHNSPDRARGGTHTNKGARESACMLVFSAASRLTYVCTLVDSCPRSNLFVSLAYSLSAP